MLKDLRKPTFFFVLIFLWGCSAGTTEEGEFISPLDAPDLPDPFEAGWKGEKVCEIVEENDKIRVLKCSFAPGVGHERHYHKPHIGYTLTGGKFEIKDSTGTRTVEVPTGYTFKNDDITVHEVLNVGETAASFLIIESK